MAKLCDLDNSKAIIIETLRKSIQSANLNFLIGSGCTIPAIPALGNVEEQIHELYTQGKRDNAEIIIFKFIKPFLEVTQKMMTVPDKPIDETQKNYSTFLGLISQILFERKNNILPRQASIFSTNYDLFIEKAYEEINMPIKLNDGFSRSPFLSCSSRFASSEFFNSVYNNGILYNYEVQIPSINLIKLHGSLSWETRGKEIVFEIGDMAKMLKDYEDISGEKLNEIEEFNQRFSIILPKKDKFKDTLLNQTYYDLLRLYANELDKENTVLITEGFSFADEHILEITKRALRNPTLRLIIFAYSMKDVESYKEKFVLFNNVDIIYSQSDIPFAKFNSTLSDVIPSDCKFDFNSIGDFNE